MKQTMELAQRRCGASSNTPTGHHLTNRDVDSVCLVLLALHSALQQAKLDVEAAPHYCTPSDDWRCRSYNGFRECNCWKAKAIAKISAALDGK